MYHLYSFYQIHVSFALFNVLKIHFLKLKWTYFIDGNYKYNFIENKTMLLNIYYCLLKGTVLKPDFYFKKGDC